MKVLKNLSVAQKLYGSFGFVLVLLVVVLAVSLNGMGRLGTANDTITQEVNPKLAAALRLQHVASDLKGWQTAYVLDRGKSRSEFEKSNKAFGAQLEKLRTMSLDAEDKASLAGVDGIVTLVPVYRWQQPADSRPAEAMVRATLEGIKNLAEQA